MATEIPRGIRNNNPLNIRISSNQWKGKILPSQDKAFEQFETMELGIRAALVIIRNYIQKHHLNTIRKIISRWAPPSENNTRSYVEFIRAQSKLNPDEPLTFSQKEKICNLAWAMALYENGVRYRCLLDKSLFLYAYTIV